MNQLGSGVSVSQINHFPSQRQKPARPPPPKIGQAVDNNLSYQKSNQESSSFATNKKKFTSNNIKNDVSKQFLNDVYVVEETYKSPTTSYASLTQGQKVIVSKTFYFSIALN